MILKSAGISKRTYVLVKERRKRRMTCQRVWNDSREEPNNKLSDSSWNIRDREIVWSVRVTSGCIIEHREESECVGRNPYI